MSKRRAHYVVRIADQICEQIALGHSMKDALAAVGVLAPALPVVWRWLSEYPEFKEKYDRARQMQADIHADKMLEMADEALRIPSKAAAIRVAADILKWQAEIRNPQKYGSKVQHEVVKSVMKPEDLKKEIAALEAELGIKAVPGMNTAPNFARKKVVDTVVEDDETMPPAGSAPAPKIDDDFDTEGMMQ
jgi:hypothetical protein